MGMSQVRYSYRLRPGKTAERYLLREWGMCRFVWNYLVAESNDRHMFNQIAKSLGASSVPDFGYAEQDRCLTRLRADMVDGETGERWLAQGSSVAQQQIVRDFAAARTKALKDRVSKVERHRQRGLPRFKSRHTARASMNYTQRGFSLVPHPVTGRLALRLPGNVVIPVVWSRELPSEPKSVRVSQDALGHWYASFVVEQPDTPTLAPNGRVIGIDWGVSETATTVSIDTRTGEINETTDYDLPHAQHGKTAAQKLARYQKMMARRQTPKNTANTRGYDHAKKHVAKAHRKIARQRQDDSRKWAKKIVTDHDSIAVEDFRPRFLATTTMARKAADAAIASAKTELLWQAAKTGRNLVLVNPRNTTTDCSTCGARTKHRLPLEERTYTCHSCGIVKPRDKNSAINMIARAGFNPADADGIRPEPAHTREQAA